MNTPALPSVRAEIVIDLEAVRENVATLKERLEGRAMMVVVKADGYGHGMVPVAQAARAGGAEWLGVAVIEEGLALRESGDTGRVLTWLAVPGEDYRPAIAADLDVTAYTVDQLGEITSAARELDTVARVQLKVDTGLNRGGSAEAWWPDLVAASAAAERDGSVRITGVWSHFACSDEPDHPANDLQEQAFRAALKVADAAGLEPEVRHLCNSAGALTRPSAWFDMVRCGIASYGLSPIPARQTSEQLGLVPAMTVQGRLALVKRIPEGAGVSYGHTYVAPQETTVGVVPMGYGDGIPRHASSAARVFVAGRSRLIAGRVCMDQFVVDIEDDEAAAGDPVVLFGAGRDGEPTAQDWASSCGTISYEIVTRMGGPMGGPAGGGRVPRRYVGTVGAR